MRLCINSGLINRVRVWNNFLEHNIYYLWFVLTHMCLVCLLVMKLTNIVNLILESVIASIIESGKKITRPKRVVCFTACVILFHLLIQNSCFLLCLHAHELKKYSLQKFGKVLKKVHIQISMHIVKKKSIQYFMKCNNMKSHYGICNIKFCFFSFSTSRCHLLSYDSIDLPTQ